MKTSLIFLSFISSFFIRALRWLSIVQQKEYRLDRISLFLKTDEGKKELWRLIPKKSDFSRTGLKRPKITLRILITLLSFSLIFCLILVSLFIFSLSFGGLLSVVLFIIALIILLILVPAVIFISVLPTVILSQLKTYLELTKARNLLKKSKPIVIGITGSYGKTSTKLLLSKVLEKKFSIFKTPKSFNTKFSVAKSINDAYTGQQIAVLEYAAYKPGEIKLLAKWLKPSMAVITGLAEQHLGLFGNIENIAKAKSELINALSQDSIVVCNDLDEKVNLICKASDSSTLQVFKTSEYESSFTKVHLSKLGKLVFVWNGLQVNTNLVGLHYLEVAKTVILVAKQFGLSDAEIADAISTFIPDDKFIFSYRSSLGYLIIDDGGTSNPKGFEAVIKLASEIESERKILLTPGIVDLGARSAQIHRELATKASEIFDVVLYTGETGKDDFAAGFSGDFIFEKEKIIEYFAKIKNSDLIVIEGKTPGSGWLNKYLK